MVPPSAEVTATEGISSISLFFSSYEHYFNTRLTIICRSCTGVRAVSSSQIEEIIKELVQPEDLEVPVTGTISEGNHRDWGTLNPEQPAKGSIIFKSSV